MKVTVDTRHDSLEEALATVRGAGHAQAFEHADRVAAGNPTSPAGVRPAKRARSRRGTATAPGTKRSSANIAAKKPVTTGQAASALDVSAVPLEKTHVAAAPSADPIARRASAKKSTKRTSKASPVMKAPVSKSAGKRAPAKKRGGRDPRLGQDARDGGQASRSSAGRCDPGLPTVARPRLTFRPPRTATHQVDGSDGNCSALAMSA